MVSELRETLLDEYPDPVEHHDEHEPGEGHRFHRRELEIHQLLLRSPIHVLELLQFRLVPLADRIEALSLPRTEPLLRPGLAHPVREVVTQDRRDRRRQEAGGGPGGGTVSTGTPPPKPITGAKTTFAASAKPAESPGSNIVHSARRNRKIMMKRDTLGVCTVGRGASVVAVSSATASPLGPFL